MTKHLLSVLLLLPCIYAKHLFNVVSYNDPLQTNYTNDRKIKIDESYFDKFFKQSIPIEESLSVDIYDRPKVFRNLDFTGCHDTDVIRQHKEEDVDYHWITFSYEYCVPYFANIPNNYNLEMFMGHWDSGKKNRITPLHWDRDPGLLWCYSGLKYVFLFPPWQQYLLYLHKPGTTGGSSTTVPFLIEEDHHEDYPNFYKATPYAVKMGKGDMLLIPAGWAHHVYSFNHTRCKTFWVT